MDGLEFFGEESIDHAVPLNHGLSVKVGTDNDALKFGSASVRDIDNILRLQQRQLVRMQGHGIASGTYNEFNVKVLFQLIRHVVAGVSGHACNGPN